MADTRLPRYLQFFNYLEDFYKFYDGCDVTVNHDDVIRRLLSAITK